MGSWNIGILSFCGRSKYFWFHGGEGLSFEGYISWGEVISFSVHFPNLKCKISKTQNFLPVAPSFLIFTFSDFRWMQGFKYILTLSPNLNFLIQGAVSFHPSVGTQNQLNPWNGFLFYLFGGLRGPSRLSSQ